MASNFWKAIKKTSTWGIVDTALTIVALLLFAQVLGWLLAH
jgi:hypothetical protein